MPKQLLVVHDDPAQLGSLEFALQPERARWQIDLYSAPLEGLAAAQAKVYDVVMVGLHMARVGGVFFLTQMKHQSPTTARVLMVDDRPSGSSLAAGYPCAHRVLRQPWNAQEMRELLSQVEALSERIQSEALRTVLGQVGTLPGFPQLYWDLCGLLRKEYYALSDAAELLQKDPAMCAKLLQIANSAYFGTTQKVTTVERALTLVGANLFRLMVLTTYAFTTITQDSPLAASFSYEVFQEHAWLTARLVKKLMGDPIAAQDGFTAGLLHNLGTLVMASRMPERYDQMVAEAQAEDIPVWQIERKTLNTDHGEVGAYLMNLWGLPNVLADAVLKHHQPIADTERIGRDIVPTLQAVVHMLHPRIGGHYKRDRHGDTAIGLLAAQPDMHVTQVQRMVTDELAVLPSGAPASW